jgi:type IV pilus assembly protein PilA
LQNYGGPLADARTDGKATGSMVLGILSLLLCFAGWLAGIPAIILGHISRSKIRKSMGRLKGDGMALAGLIMGYISVVGLPFMLIIAAIAIPNLIRARQSANESSAMSTVRRLGRAQVEYQANNPNVGYAADVATLGPAAGTVTEHCTGNNLCTNNGYLFMIQTDEQQPHQVFVITAVPEKPERTGTRNFCESADGVLRYERPGSPRAPYSPEECAALVPVGD